MVGDGSTPADQGQRIYAGLTGEERRARRRQTLLDAAFELVGNDGYHAATVRAICKAAGLSERYFYENFDSREDIFSAVFENAIHAARDTVVSAIASVGTGASSASLIRRGVAAFIRHAASDDRRVAVIFIDVPGITTDRDVLRVASTTSFSQLIEQAFVEVYGVTHPHQRHMANGLVGLISRLMGQWRFDGADPDQVEALIDTCDLCFTSTAAAFAAEAQAPEPMINDAERIAEALGKASEQDG